MSFVAGRALRFCALVAVLLVLSITGDRAAGAVHADCADDHAACSCACHDTIVIHTPGGLFFSGGVVGTVTGDPCFYSALIPADIFRPPAV